MPEYYLINGTRYTLEEVRLAEKLIFKGRTFATRGDPRMTSLVRKLERRGYMSAGEMEAIRVQEQIKIGQEQRRIKKVEELGGVESEFFKQSLPAEDYQERIRRIKPTGVESEFFKQSLSAEQYQERLRRIKIPSKGMEDISQEEFQRRTPQRGTIIDYREKDFGQIYLSPYVKKEQTGTITTRTGRKIPKYEYVYVDPTGKGRQLERSATQQEIKSFQDYERSLSIERGTASVTKPSRTIQFLRRTGVVDLYGSLKTELETSQYEIGEGLGVFASAKIKKIERRTGLDLPLTIQESRERVRARGESLRERGVPEYVVKSGEFISFYQLSLLESIKGKPIKYGVIAGVGAGIGFLGKGIMMGASKLGKITGVTARMGVTGAGVGLTGAYTYDVGARLFQAKGIETKADIFADVTLETASAVGGYKLGVKSFERLSVIGKEYVPVESIVPEQILKGKETFVVSETYGYKGRVGLPKQKFDIKVFREKGVGYHVTPEKFYKSKIIVEKGTSEFEGLYVAPEASIYFAKVGAKGYKLFPSVKELISFDRPAIAKIYPKGFSITKKGELGVGYVTGVKPEIEAVLPVGSEFLKIGTPKYTTFKGKVILLDEFQYMKGLKKDSIKTLSTKEIRSSYGAIEKEALIYPETLSASYRASISYKPSLKSSYRLSKLDSSKLSLKSSYLKPSYKPSYAKSSLKSSVIPDKYYSDASIISSIKDSGRSFKRSYVPSLYRIGRSRIPPSSYYDPRRILTPPKIPRFKKRKTKKRFKEEETYSVLIKRRGKFKSIYTDLTIGEARKRLSKRLLRTLARTGKIIKTGRRKEVFGMDEDFKLQERIFRPYKIRKGKKIFTPEEYIQRTSANLQTIQEKSELKEARRLKKLVGF